jgi:molecular chaperone GrpE
MDAGLWAETEALLNALRQWIVEFEAAAVDGAEGRLRLDAAGGGVDLHTVVAEIAALKGEVRLESRVAKTSREKMERAAESFEEGLESARSALHDTVTGVEEGLRSSLAPLLRERDQLREELHKLEEEGPLQAIHALLDVHEALRRGREATEEACRRLGWRRRLLPRALLGGLLEGYDMGCRRLERRLEELGVVEIACAGRDFDPRRMRSVESEVRSDLPAGRVLEVLRPGFTRGEQVLRYAEVRIAAAPQGEEGGERHGL